MYEALVAKWEGNTTTKPPPFVEDLDSIFAICRAKILRATIVEQQLAPHERSQTRQQVYGALGQLNQGLREWLEEYVDAGTLISAEQAAELKRLLNDSDDTEEQR